MISGENAAGDHLYYCFIMTMHAVSPIGADAKAVFKKMFPQMGKTEPVITTCCEPVVCMVILCSKESDAEN